MVGDPSLREVVGADALGTVARADQAFARAGDVALLGAHLDVPDARGQHAQSGRPVGVLRTAILTFGDDAGRDVRDAHGRIGLVDVLTAGSRGAEGIDAQIGRVEGDLVDLVGFRHDRHGARRGMDATLGFGLRDALHAMGAGLEFQARIDAGTDDAADDLAIAAEIRFAGRDDLDLPALALGIARIHAEEVAGEQRRFVAASAGADFENDALLVVGVARKQQFLQLDLEFGQARLDRGDLLVGELAHLGVAAH